MPKQIHYAPTANCRDRTEPIRYIIIHCSAFSTDRLLDMLDKYGLSTHYIISERGVITQNCEPEKVAYHAGDSRWLGSEGRSLNGCSIGIELEAAHLGQNEGDYSRATIMALNVLLRDLVYKYNIRKENILGHSDIAPTRKSDPGRAFPWHKLYKKEFGVWYRVNGLSPETDETALLKSIGYDTENLAAARCAFCRRFYPEAVKPVTNLQLLLDHPFEPDFMPDDQEKYINILRATALAFEEERKRRYWFMERKKTAAEEGKG